MPNPLLVGVDIHRKTNSFCIMDSQGRILSPPSRTDNNRPGTETFIRKVIQTATQAASDSIQIAAEATGMYWWHFFQTLAQDPFLNQFPTHLYPINPRMVANFKKSYGEMDKTDNVDAFAIADRLRMGRNIPKPFQPDHTFFPLRCLTRYRFHIVHNLAREKAYCLSILYLKASEYSRLMPFSDIFGAASRAVLQEFSSIEEISQIPFDQLVQFIKIKGKNRFPDPRQNADKLKLVAENSYHLPQSLKEPINLILEMSLKQISSLHRQEQQLNEAIAHLMEDIPHTLNSIPGFGPVFSAAIIAEIGDLERFDYNQAKVAKYAGFSWRKHQSGQFQAEETPLSRSGNRYLRYYLCEAANRVRMHAPEYADYYAKKYKEVPKHRHKRAIVLTARKLIRLIVRLLTDNQPYQPRRCKG